MKKKSPSQKKFRAFENPPVKSVPPEYRLAVEAMKKGHHSQALKHTEDSVTNHPDFAEAWNLRGLLLFQFKQTEKAIESLQQAIAAAPDKVDYHLNLGRVLLNSHLYHQFVEHFQQTHRQFPHHLPLIEQGVQAYTQLEDWTSLQPLLLELLAHHANDANHRFLISVAYFNCDELEQAYFHVKELLSIEPEHPEGLQLLANIQETWKDYADAIRNLQKLVQTRPNRSEAWYNLGNLYGKTGNYPDAVRCYQKTLQLAPDLDVAANNMGAALEHLGMITQARRAYEMALQTNPEAFWPLTHLAFLLIIKEEYVNARELFQKALATASAESNSGKKASPYHAPEPTVVRSGLMQVNQRLCDWQDWEDHMARLIEDSLLNNQATTPWLFLTLPTTRQQQLELTRNWAQTMFKKPDTRLENTPPRVTVSGDERITIGYLSADYHVHATAILIGDLFRLHNRKDFRVVGYSYGIDDGSALRREIMDCFDEAVDLRELSFEAAAQRIAQDGVDVLVDLKGYTQNSRMEILCYRPAPIQVHYLGYPGTLAHEMVDYLVVDPILVPSDHIKDYSEALVYLPDCYQVNRASRPCAERVPTRAELGLPEDAFVFCCFNQNYKITPDIFAVWMKLLREVPDSVLWLLEGHEEVVTNLRREAFAAGVSPDRLVFAPLKLIPDHLVRYHHADLFLDTQPVSAHTTASDALWMGCPLLTILGETFASRVGASIANAVGLPELIAHNPEEYLEKALYYAQNPGITRALRQRLLQQRSSSPLFAVEKFTRYLEQAFRTMVHLQREGSSPATFSVVGE